MQADKNTFLIPYDKDEKSLKAFLKNVSFCMADAFRRRKKIYLVFILIFSFFALLGYFFTVYNPLLADTVFNFVYQNVLLKSLSFYDVFIFSLPFLSLLFLTYLLSFTVFGRVIPFLVYAFFAFSFGIIDFVLLNSFELFSFLIPLICFSALLFFISVFMTEAFMYSRRSLYGISSLFFPKAFLNYFALFTSLLLTVLILLYIIFLFK